MVVLPVGPLAILAAVEHEDAPVQAESLATPALPSAPPQLPHVLTSEAEIFFFSVVLVDVSAEDIYWGEGEREQRTQFR